MGYSVHHLLLQMNQVVHLYVSFRAPLEGAAVPHGVRRPLDPVPAGKACWKYEQTTMSFNPNKQMINHDSTSKD